MDFFGERALVETHVAIAFGASVHPFTNTTPSVNTVITNKAGLCVN